MKICYTIRDIRNAYKPRNSWWGYFILHPVATRVLWFFANFTTVRPEVLCLTSLFVGLVTAYFFWLGTPQSLFIGAILAFTSNLFDAMDGKLARLKGLVSAFGGYLDFLVDVIKHILYVVVLVLGQYQHTNDIQTLYWGLAVLFVFTTIVANENLLGRIRAFLPHRDEQGKTGSEEVPQKQSQSVFIKIDQFFKERSLLPGPCGVEFVTVMFILGPLVNQVMLCLVLGGACFTLYGIVYTLMILKRTQWLTKSLTKDRR
jgi:phosphatidylglycerophosphate synthase